MKNGLKVTLPDGDDEGGAESAPGLLCFVEAGDFRLEVFCRNGRTVAVWVTRDGGNAVAFLSAGVAC